MVKSFIGTILMAVALIAVGVILFNLHWAAFWLYCCLICYRLGYYIAGSAYSSNGIKWNL